jgi:hypothetical protein
MSEFGQLTRQDLQVLSHPLTCWIAALSAAPDPLFLVPEDSIPFAEREPVLKASALSSSAASGNLRDAQRRQQAYDVEIRDLREKSDRDSQPLLPLARQFGVEEAFTKSLEKQWTERLRRLIGAAPAAGGRSAS